MEEYIKLEEEKARRRGKVYNWETAKYGKIWYDEDVHDLRSVETEFPAIVFNDELSSEKALSCKPTVSYFNNNEIDFRISFDESDDEDYTVIFDKNSFSYKIISVNDLKTDSENDNEKVNMPLFPSPEPTVSYFDDLDFLKDFENGFPAIVYNDALTSKSDSLTEPVEIHHHVDEFDLKDETSWLGIILSTGCYSILLRIYMAPLPPRNQRHMWLRYQVEGYTKEMVHDFEDRLETIYGRQVNRVHVLDFEGLTTEMRQDLAERVRMVYNGDDGKEIFVSHALKRLFEIRAPLVHEFILKFLSTCRIALGLHTAEEMAEYKFEAYWLGSERVIPDKGGLSDYWIEISSDRDFLRVVPSYTYIKDPMWRLCHRLISYNISERGQAPKKVTATDLFYLRSMDRGTSNILYLLAQYLFRHAEGRKSGARLSGGHFIGHLAHHFGLVSDDGLRGLSFDEYPSFCDFDRKIHINYAYNLRFSCMIGFEHVDANFFPILSVNMMSREFYNSIMRDKWKIWMATEIKTWESNLDEPFCKASCVEARRFDGLIILHNGSDNVTYQMARLHPRFKHLSNAQCNKIKPLLKVSLHDKLNEISHPYHDRIKPGRPRCKEIDKVGEVSII
ncbi:hypothetical protein Tco_1243524 [Tanacetum coccineum]